MAQNKDFRKTTEEIFVSFLFQLDITVSIIHRKLFLFTTIIDPKYLRIFNLLLI